MTTVNVVYFLQISHDGITDLFPSNDDAHAIQKISFTHCDMNTPIAGLLVKHVNLATTGVTLCVYLRHVETCVNASR